MTVHNTIRERNSVHGDFNDNARIAQSIKEHFRSQRGWADLSIVQREALDVIALKLGRILSGDPNHSDHWHDVAGYATLAEQSIQPKIEQSKLASVVGTTAVSRALQN